MHLVFCCCCCSVLSLCDSMDYSLQPHGLQHAWLLCPPLSPEFAQVHVHWVGDSINHLILCCPPSSSAFNLSQHQGLFQWVLNVYIYFSFYLLIHKYLLKKKVLVTYEHYYSSKIFYYWNIGIEEFRAEKEMTIEFSVTSDLQLVQLIWFTMTEWKPQSQKTNQTDHMDHSPF